MDKIIAISIDGGLIQGIWANHPDLIGVKVVIVDYDTDGADSDETVNVKDCVGNDSEAYVRIDKIVSGPDIQPAIDTF